MTRAPDRPVEIMKQTMERMGISEISVQYGMTEPSPNSMLSQRDDNLEKRVTTVGRVMPYVGVEIIDPARWSTSSR
jgi:fatty-acyl-CoA synthase